MIYISSSCVNAKYIREVIKCLADSGIKNIELSGGTDYYDELETDLIKLKKDYDLNYAVHSYFPPPKEHFAVNLASCDDDIYQKSKDHYRNALRLIKNIGCDTLSIHAGFYVNVRAEELGKEIKAKKSFDLDESCDRFCKAYESLSYDCKSEGVDLYLENNVVSLQNYINAGNFNVFMMTDYESILSMKKKLDFKLLLDLAHLNVSCHTLGCDYHEQLGLLADIAEWIHVSDNDGISDLHRTLGDDNGVLKGLNLFSGRRMNITLESKGDMTDIKRSLEIIKRYDYI